MKEVPGYKILETLGTGGMAMVYLAEHEKLGRRVAIKVLSDVLTADYTVRERFLQEARVMASLSHPGIVQVTDYVETEHTLAFVMEYIEGRNLSEIIGREVGPIPAEKALQMFRQILEAAGYAHDRGIIHRDLKPSNVMVTDDGTAKIMDFGIAKIAGGAGHTRTGTKLGTLYYMSPEQLRGSKHVDHRADIYSLGMTLYEMLAGRLPFDTESETSEFDITQKIVFEEFEPPSDYYPHIPDHLVDVVRKATAKDPDQRFQSCMEFMEALDSGQAAVKSDSRQDAPASKAAPPMAEETSHASPASEPARETLATPATRTASGSGLWWKITIPVVGLGILLVILLSSGATLPNGMEFVSIPSGSFRMGSPSSEDGRDDDEGPVHTVRVDTFELMTTEVTQGMWKEVMGENPSHDYGVGDNYPVYYVSWSDCQEFIDRLKEMDPSHTYRLPSEAEWEYACRAGTTTRYYWGNSDAESVMKRYCWYDENSDGSTHPVGTKEPNAWGLYDMSGNVHEWCEDKYHQNYSGAPTDGSAWMSGWDSSNRMNRGGSWLNFARGCRSAYRFRYSPGRRRLNLGLRLARSDR
jgi:formylglycine-generating enzyme required for sulfatase activity/predicted Ser/Thr protein kinase